MCKRCCPLDTETSLSELKHQVEYARTVCSDIFKAYSPEKPDADELIIEYKTVRTKLSMMLDFLFQAELWCDTLEQSMSEGG